MERFLPCVLLALAGCSVLGLDDFDRCDELGSTVAEQEAACANALNGEIGAPENCRPFRCIDGECVEQDVELCDGADNDCDGAVDEEIFAPSEFASVGYENNAFNLTVATDGTEARAFWTESTGTTGGSGASAALRPSIDTERTPVGYFSHPDLMMDESRGIPRVQPLEEGCWRRTVDETGELVSVNATTARCDFSAMETSREGQSTLVATLDGAGCSAGRLRLGHIDAPGQLAVVGPLARSNSFMGVGLTPDGDCSAAMPDLCQAALDANMVGAASPCVTSAECSGTSVCVCGNCLSPENAAVAIHCGFADFAMDTVEDPASTLQLRGLIAAVSGSFSAARCKLPDFSSTASVDESLREVAVFGAYLNQQQGFTYVNANDEGTPTILTPQTSGVGAPGVLGVGDSFIVAYPSPTQTLTVHIIAPPAALTTTDVTMCQPTPGGVQTCASPQQPVCQDTLCGSDTGVCTSGSPSCFNGERFCQGVRNPDVVEECDNGLDDDCDGRTDESPCEDDRTGMAVTETCNGIDDDFDGMVDEGAVTGRFTMEQRRFLANPALPDVEVQVGDPCGETDGTCVRGTVACVGGQLLCEGVVAPRTNASRNLQDLCGNGEDDDCDGAVDEASCGTCVMSPELCNGRDDDCDGVVDEDVTNLTGLSIGPTSRDSETVRQCAPTPGLNTTPDVAEGFPMPFDDVVLSAGPRDSEGLNVGVAYREVLADGSSHVTFRIVKFHVDCTCRGGGTCGESSCDELLTPTGTRSDGDPVRLSVTPGNYGSPTLAYAPTGFRAGVGEETGGWYVLWTELGDMGDSTLVGRRVALQDGMPTDPAPFSATSASSNPRTPYVYSDDSGAGYAFIDARSQQVVSARLVCAPDAMR